MKRFVINSSLSLIFGLGLTLALLWLFDETPPVAHADPGDLFASPTGSGIDCSKTQPCTLQTALDQATGGDTVYLAAGIYTGSGGAVVTVTKSITLCGGWDGNATTPIVRDSDTYITKLDGQGQRRVVYIAAGNPTLDGLHLTNGAVIGHGGGVYADSASHPVINDCQIYNNRASGTGNNGGGFYTVGSATLTGNRVYSNTAYRASGGIYFRGNSTLTGNEICSNTAQTHNGGGVALIYGDDAMLANNRIYNNTAGEFGGGIVLYRSNATLTGNEIYNNVADDGGGINVNETENNSVTLADNRICSNTARLGGGIMVGDCPVTMTGNLVYDNAATLGGGVWLIISDALLVNDIVVGNRTTGSGGGSGVYMSGSDVRMLHTTIARNSGGGGAGIYVTDFGAGNNSTLALTNTILVSHSVGIQVASGHTVTVNSVLWHNTPTTVSQSLAATVTVQNQVTGDPAFFIPDIGDYHILPTSAAVDAGVAAGVETDIDGQARPRDLLYDIGADKLNDYTFLHLPLALKNYP
jgi:fibronectin-binding autotransporter adhesin